jgi:adenosylcobinamide-phosphate synthase
MLDLLTYNIPAWMLMLPLLAGWLLDLVLGDPQRLPHPVVGFGRMIAFGEHRLNHGHHRLLKGALLAVGLIALVFCATCLVRHLLLVPLSSQLSPHPAFLIIFDAAIIFYCLAGTTLIREVKAVFMAVDRSLDEGRRQVARIVGRDTTELSAQEVRTAALETLAENLSDGVIAPLFWLALLGTPGMMAYKMVNTLDSMIGYRTERYRQFGCWAARIDDAANYIPARLTALLMVMGFWLICLLRLPTTKTAPAKGLIRQVWSNGRKHASPNSGYPEAALAAILDCRFGGPHSYFGQVFDKPYIGTNERPLSTADMRVAVAVNRTAEAMMVAIVLLWLS